MRFLTFIGGFFVALFCSVVVAGVAALVIGIIESIFFYSGGTPVNFIVAVCIVIIGPVGYICWAVYTCKREKAEENARESRNREEENKRKQQEFDEWQRREEAEIDSLFR